MQPAPPFFIQIVDAAGRVIRTPAGGTHEADLIELIVSKVLPLGVGFLRSESHVEQDLRDGIAAAILSLKVKNPFEVLDV